MALTLKQQLTEAMKSAMKAHEKQRLAAIRLILSAIKQREVDERIEVDDTTVLQLLDKMLKQRRDSIEQYGNAGRADLVAQEEYEVGVIQSFMPQPLSDSDISALIKEAIAASGATSIKEMGQVMALLKPQMQGRADMGKVSGLIKAALA
ncbi:MAG: GatB/YqeY domain-containing protein [Gammaproteobacteria bacterium]|nr:GatB/YqeY domain-containing protein [Gammaproteobacteria bacterium]